MILKLIQGFIDGFGALLNVIVGILPGSPFTGLYNLAIDNKWLGYLSYIIPVPQILALLQAWIVSVSMFYVYMIILRWVKAIE